MKKVQKQRHLSQATSLLSTLFSKNYSYRKKLMVLAVIIYIVSPIDLIPDFIPLAGYADDVLLPMILFLANKYLVEDKERKQVNEIIEN